MKQNIPRFHIGSIPVYGRIALSPMAHFSDSAYRRLARRFGSAWSVSEFVPADAVMRGEVKFLDRFRFTEEERPVILQLFGSDPAVVAQAAAVAADCGADAVELNMGCSVKEIVGKGAGAGLLRDPALAAAIVEAMRARVRIPVTAKIRTGWDDKSRNYLDVARRLEEAGAAMISVHGRTKAQGYTGLSDWDAIARVRDTVSVPVIGSGDVGSLADAERRIRETGVDGVLVGRAAMGNPWLFSGIEAADVGLDERLCVMKLHYEWMLELYGDQASLLFRKHAARYLPVEAPQWAPMRSALLGSATAAV